MEKRVIKTINAPLAIGHYSQAIEIDNILFTSGQSGFDPVTNTLVGPDIASQTHQTLKNLGAILEAGGYSLENVVKCTVFLQDIDEFSIMNTIYAQYFPNNPPARSTIQVQLGFNARVEIEMIAMR